MGSGLGFWVWGSAPGLSRSPVLASWGFCTPRDQQVDIPAALCQDQDDVGAHIYPVILGVHIYNSSPETWPGSMAGSGLCAKVK